MSNLVRSIFAWLNEPWQEPLSTIDIFLLIGLILVFLVIWGRILAHLKEVGV